MSFDRAAYGLWLEALTYVRNLHDFVILALIAVSCFAAAPVRAAMPVCSSVFTSDSEVQTLSKINDELERLSYRMRTTQNMDDQDFANAATLAATLLSSAGANFKLIQYHGAPALEIVPDGDLKSGWNKMAASLVRVYGARLVYSPQQLALHRAYAATVPDEKVILISRESLRVGRAERNNLHELAHLHSQAVKDIAPNLFSGFIEVANTDTQTSIAAGTNDYVQSMEMDEIPRIAQDLENLARQLRSARDEKETQKARAELKSVASRAQNVIKNQIQESIFSKRLAAQVKNQPVGSGPVFVRDGSLDLNQVVVYFGANSQIVVERRPTGAVRLRLESDDLTSEIWIRGDLDAHDHGSWKSLIAALQHEDSFAIREFQSRFTSLVQDRETSLGPVLDSLRETTQAIISSSGTDLAALAYRPGKVIAPHLKRDAPK